MLGSNTRRRVRGVAVIVFLALTFILGWRETPKGLGFQQGIALVSSSVIPYTGEPQDPHEHRFFANLGEEEIGQAVSECVKNLLGPEGLAARIAAGSKVVVKTNIVRPALGEGVVTDPRVCRAVCRLALAATGPTGSVKVVDSCFDDGMNAWRLARYDLDRDGRFDGLEEVELVDLENFDARSSVLSELDPLNFWREIYLPDILRTREQAETGPPERRGVYCDYLISTPNLKNHSNAGVTLALKNRVGCASLKIYGPRWAGISSIHFTPSRANCLNEAIVDLNRARPNDLVILDGLTGNRWGPIFNSRPPPDRHAHVIHPFFFLASEDSVALDVVGAVLMGYDPKSVHYLELATRMGLGWNDPARISVVGPSVETIRDELRSRYGARRKWPFPSNYGTVNRSRLAADLTPPAICRIRKPLQGQVLEPGVVTIEVEARDGEELAKTEVFVEGELLELFPLDGQERKLLASWDASAASSGPYRIWAVTYDRNFNETKSEAVTVRFGAPTLVRGEVDGASGINISDVIFLLGYLFLGDSEPACLDATDVDDDGVVDLTDPIRLLGYLFLGSAPPPPPFPTCEEDPTDDALGCAASVCDF